MRIDVTAYDFEGGIRRAYSIACSHSIFNNLENGSATIELLGHLRNILRGRAACGRGRGHLSHQLVLGAAFLHFGGLLLVFLPRSESHGAPWTGRSVARRRKSSGRESGKRRPANQHFFECVRCACESYADPRTRGGCSLSGGTIPGRE